MKSLRVLEKPRISILSGVGQWFANRLPRRRQLRMISQYGPTAGFLAQALQTYALQTEGHIGRYESQLDKSGDLLATLVTPELTAQYAEAVRTWRYEFTGVYPTDGLILWALIQHCQPEVMIESGTGTGYSSQICLEGLRRYVPSGRLITIGEAAPKVMATARRRLASYPECELVEGRVPAELIPLLDAEAGKSVGIFVDGPKGSSPEFWQLLETIFQHTRPVFVAVHDCEAHLPRGFDPGGKWPQGRLNPTRAQLIAYYELAGLAEAYRLMFMDDRWCEAHDELNATVYEGDFGLAPYVFKKSRQRSHSPYLGVLLPRE